MNEWMNVTIVSAELTSWCCHLANKAGNVWHRRVSAIKLKQLAFIDIRMISLHPAIATHRHTAHYDQTWCHPQNRKYMAYRNAARGGPSHDHKGSAQQISWRSVQRFQKYACGFVLILLVGVSVLFSMSLWLSHWKVHFRLKSATHCCRLLFASRGSTSNPITPVTGISQFHKFAISSRVSPPQRVKTSDR